MNSEDDMMRYVRHSALVTLLIMFGCLALAYILIRASLQTISAGKNDFMNVLLLCAGVFAVLGAFMPLVNSRKMMKFLKESNIYGEAVIDFASAQPFLEDKIRIGSKYVFGRKCYAVLRYTDIVKLYQGIHTSKGREVGRELHAVDIAGKDWCIGKLKAHYKLAV